MIGYRILPGLVALLLPAPLPAQSFDNASVIALHRAGLGEGPIVAKIESLPCAYDVSTDALIVLKRAGVPDLAIAAMVRRCNAAHRSQGASMTAADPDAPHAPGIYVGSATDAAALMRVMRPSKASSIRVSGNGSLIWPFVGRLVLPDGHSQMAITDQRPPFYFYFPTRDRGMDDFGTPNAAAQSPAEFSLVRLRSKGDERQVGIGRLTAFAGRGGIDAKDTVEFTSTDLSDSAFRVEPKTELAPGEYAFVLTGANNSARVYDFTIR